MKGTGPSSGTSGLDPGEGPRAEWTLKLYVAGSTTRSVIALENLRRICEEHLEGRYTIEVIDLSLHPELAQSNQILALPTLVRELPSPIRKIIGDLSDTERVLVGLDVRTRPGQADATGPVESHG